MSSTHSFPESSIDHIIGQKVRWLRREKRLLATDVAHKLNVTIVQYTEAEAGDRCFSNDQLETIATLFKVDAASLVPADPIVRKLILSQVRLAAESGGMNI